MAMVVKNNLSALNTLNTLNVNNSELAKSLKKVSSGMRITGAGDDASGYAIGKGMEVMVRALGQDVQNVKTGNNLIAVAEGGIQSVLANLRNMKEMLLNSMNDHNSDLDRDTLNKEYAKRLETITDIAADTSYNGRRLLNGNYYSPKSMRYEAPVELPLEEGRDGKLYPVYNVEYTNDPVTSVWKYKTANPVPATASTNSSSGTSSASGTNSSAGVSSGGVKQNTLTGLASAFSPLTSSTTKGNGFNNGVVTANSSYTGAMQAKIDFSGAVNPSGATGTALNYPSDFDQQGFSITCGGCYQYINIRFDASTTQSTYEPNFSPTNYQATEYVIGIANVTDEASLEDALFDGIKNAVGRTVATLTDKYKSNTYYYPITQQYAVDQADSICIDPAHDLRLVRNPNGGYYISKEESGAPKMGIYDEGTYEPDNPPFPLPPTPQPEPTNEEEDDPGNPLIIHHGPRQNQYLPVYINSMHPRALKIEGTATSPRELAALSLGYMNFAIEYALNEATRMGAYRSRLEFTEDNLVTGQENTQSAESTMQDADMAKEMATYTKNNVLTQSAQSMLSQANQNVGSVLDLLQ